jgi:S-formylglutathione hydrolase FrmB
MHGTQRHRRWVTPNWLPVGLVVLSGVTLWAGQASAASSHGAQNSHGLHVEAQSRIDPRLFSYTMTTAALPGAAVVEVLLPTGYFSHPRERYPVLYLLQPQANPNEWVTTGDAEQTTAGQPLIVVMPALVIGSSGALGLKEAGAGWCTNWVNGGKFGPPEWTTFHIDEVIPWVDQHFRTIANRGGRAMAGMSEGGFCAASYGARYPGLFGTVSSYSGGVDIATNPAFESFFKSIVNYAETDVDHVPATSMFGNPTKYQLNWADHDPGTLAENLRNTNIYLYAGNGQAGPLPTPTTTPHTPDVTAFESAATEDNAGFHQVLVKLGIKNTLDDYGPGVHQWPYWARDLQENLPEIMNDFAHPVDNPASFTFKTVTPSYSIYGWRVAITRPAPEFSSIEHARTGGFTLSGSGSAVVTTPDRYKAGASYRVVMSGSRVHLTQSILAGTAGDLQIAVPLGPGNRHAEYAHGRGATHVYTTRVTIGRAGG